MLYKTRYIRYATYLLTIAGKILITYIFLDDGVQHKDDADLFITVQKNI